MDETRKTSGGRSWAQMVGPAEFAVAGRTGLAAAMVYLALLWHARGKGSCYPSSRALGKLLGTPERTVRHHLRTLVAQGLVRRVLRRGRATTYFLVEASPAAGPRQDPAAAAATSCRRARQDLATEEYTSNNNKEQQSSQGVMHPDAEEVSMPPELRTEAFAAAWQSWLAYRRKRRLSLLKETLEGQLRKLARLGPEAAAAEIDNSITAGYQSVCYERNARYGNFPARNLSQGPGQRFDSGPNEPGSI
jgi:hypothetical protein